MKLSDEALIKKKKVSAPGGRKPVLKKKPKVVEDDKVTKNKPKK